MNRSLHNVPKDNSEQELHFDFKKSLKHTPRFPILKHLRVERYLTRPLASLVVRMVWRTRITPNQLTVISFLMGIAASGFFLLATPRSFRSAGLLTILSSVFDCADGMLARSRNQESRFGEYLDVFLDRITEFFLFAGLTVGYYFYSGNRYLLYLGGLSLALFFLQITLYYLVREFNPDRGNGANAEPRGFTLFLLSVCHVQPVGCVSLFRSLRGRDWHFLPDH